MINAQQALALFPTVKDKPVRPWRVRMFLRKVERSIIENAKYGSRFCSVKISLRKSERKEVLNTLRQLGYVCSVEDCFNRLELWVNW